MPLRLRVGERKLDLSIDPPGPDQCRIEALDPVRGHDDLDVAALVESIKLVEELQHGSLYLSGTTARRIVPFASDGIDLVDKDDRGAEIVGDPEELPHELRTVTQVLLDKLRPNDAQKGSGGVIGHGLGQQCLARSRLSVKDDPLRGLDTNVFVEFRMGQRELDGLLDFLDLVLEASDVRVAFQRGLLDLHDADHRIRVVRQYPNDAHRLVVKQDRGTGIEKILVDTGQNINVVFGTDGGTHNGMVVVDELLQRSDPQGRTTQFFQFFSFFLVAFLGRLEDLVVADEFFLHEQIILDPLQFQQPQLALGCRNDRRGFVETRRALPAAAASLPVGRARLEALFLFLLFGAVGIVLRAISAWGRSASPAGSGLHVSHSVVVVVVVVISVSVFIFIVVFFIFFIFVVVFIVIVVLIVVIFIFIFFVLTFIVFFIVIVIFVFVFIVIFVFIFVFIVFFVLVFVWVLVSAATVVVAGLSIILNLPAHGVVFRNIFVKCGWGVLIATPVVRGHALFVCIPALFQVFVRCDEATEIATVHNLSFGHVVPPAAATEAAIVLAIPMVSDPPVEGVIAVGPVAMPGLIVTGVVEAFGGVAVSEIHVGPEVDVGPLGFLKDATEPSLSAAVDGAL
mmetsp:Transcript_23550/g.52208  ORF Transcript_23550/g.52208 Transcript_23550/m.52208 type:complete len:624 (-) Transcript_23550:392-2263(-)